MSDDEYSEQVADMLKEEDRKALVQALADRLALALKATAAHYRSCAPEAPTVLETLGVYVADPEKAAKRIQQEEESLRRLHRTR